MIGFHIKVANRLNCADCRCTDPNTEISSSKARYDGIGTVIRAVGLLRSERNRKNSINRLNCSKAYAAISKVTL